MFGDGGKVYWGRRERVNANGIVAIFGWISIRESHLKDFVDLYASLGWNSLICHANFLTPFFSEKSMSLAYVVLNELVEELRVKQCPIVFVSFSGGQKACMYKVCQIMKGMCEAKLNPDDTQLIRNSIAGHIYDSCPVDITSDLGARFALHPSSFGPPKLLSWAAKGAAYGMDALFLTRFESQRSEFWQTLYSSVDFGAPYLLICSERDDFAPYEIISNFAQRLQDFGGDVNLVNFNGSPHVGHYKHNPDQYEAAVAELLEKAASTYSQRMLRLERERCGVHDEISEIICSLQNAADNSNQSFSRVAISPSDHFFLPSSTNYQSGTSQDEQKERSLHSTSPPRICPNSVLGQILFDVCIPKNVEGWDIKFGGSVNGQPVSSARRYSPANGIKGVPRSRL
ncbi:Protein of unknown function DUF829, TMEM53 [Dillenia turbinata]|uniref:Uncharacterized protein n=1 Tax=Dillenia turbinata TaxID=194707 RepID=A0AAN8UV53_9MAGN